MTAKRKDKEYNEMYELYKEGLTVYEIAKLYGIRPQTVMAGFKLRGFDTSRNYQPETWFNGEKFTLRNNGYFARSTGNRRLLHRVVWEHFHGDIPINFQVHHIDGNKWNNHINNLELLHTSDHAKYHYSYRRIDEKGRLLKE